MKVTDYGPQTNIIDSLKSNFQNKQNKVGEQAEDQFRYTRYAHFDQTGFGDVHRLGAMAEANKNQMNQALRGMRATSNNFLSSSKKSDSLMKHNSFVLNSPGTRQSFTQDNARNNNASQ